MAPAAFLSAVPLTSAKSRFGTSSQCNAKSSPFAGYWNTVPSRRTAISRASWLMKVGIYFSTTTGNTQAVADMIKESLGDEADNPTVIDEVDEAVMTSYDTLVVGAPTWNTGAETERSSTGFDDFLYDKLPNLDMSGKSVAVFGCGDATGYGDNYCDAIEELHDCFQKQGANMIGYTGTDYVDFEESKSVRDGKFLGLALDFVNDAEGSGELVSDWCAQITKESKVASTA